MARERFRIRVTKDNLVFCSGHFITYEGDRCERLHGHNYRTAVEIEAPLDENFYVFDFIALKHRIREITNELDHRMMLPTKNPLVTLETVGEQIHVRYRDRSWNFPKGDCVLLPIENTTAELLARYIGQRLIVSLKEHHKFSRGIIRVEVEESFGQSAFHEVEIGV